jgi:hypothetical protein
VASPPAEPGDEVDCRSEVMASMARLPAGDVHFRALLLASWLGVLATRGRFYGARKACTLATCTQLPVRAEAAFMFPDVMVFDSQCVGWGGAQLRNLHNRASITPNISHQ